MLNALLSFGKRTEPDNRAELLRKYQHMRAVSRQLNNRLMKQIDRDVLDEGARRLGMMNRGVLVFDSEAEMAVLMDYCLHNVRRQGRTMIEQFLIDHSSCLKSDELICLKGLQDSIYSLVLVESVVRGVGISVKDLLTGEAHLIVDIGFSESAVPGLVLASRIIFHDDFAMTSGAALPAGLLAPTKREALIRQFSACVDRDGVVDPTAVIRSLRRQGSSQRVEYREEPELSPARPPTCELQPSKVSRNSPCPCGSGRKFKHCCLNRE